MKNKRKIAIALIHNNDQNRISYILPKIDALVIKLQKKINVVFLDINQQPKLKSLSMTAGFFRDLMYWKLGRDWAKYRKVKNYFIFFDFGLLMINSVKKYIFTRELAQRWARSCAIEIYVTNKHFKAFAGALECQADYLICFEDDTIFLDDSINKLAQLVNDLENQTKTVPLYIDLAGGCRLNDLKIDNLETKRDNNFRYYSKPTTNTACCYLVNRKQLMIFDYFLTRVPVLRYIGIDWCMNKIFMLQADQNIKVVCRHADPHFFNHGSVTGECQSWAR